MRKLRKEICEVCEKKTKELFSFDGIVSFCRKCAKEGVKDGETPHTYLYKYENKKFVKFEIKNL